MRQFFFCISRPRRAERRRCSTRGLSTTLSTPRSAKSSRRKVSCMCGTSREGIDVPWQEFFHTDRQERGRADRARESGMTCEWTGSAGCVSASSRPRVVEHPRTGEKLFFNQVQLHHVYCLDEETRDVAAAALRRGGSAAECLLRRRHADPGRDDGVHREPLRGTLRRVPLAERATSSRSTTCWSSMRAGHTRASGSSLWRWLRCRAYTRSSTEKGPRERRADPSASRDRDTGTAVSSPARSPSRARIERTDLPAAVADRDCTRVRLVRRGRRRECLHRLPHGRRCSGTRPQPSRGRRGGRGSAARAVSRARSPDRDQGRVRIAAALVVPGGDAGHDLKIQFCGPAGANAVDAALKLCKTATWARRDHRVPGSVPRSTHSAMAVTGRRHKVTGAERHAGRPLLPIPVPVPFLPSPADTLPAEKVPVHSESVLRTRAVVCPCRPQ